MKTSELIGPALDWAVAQALGAKFVKTPESQSWLIHWPSPLFGAEPRWSKYAPDYSTDWSQGGPIIDREGIGLSQDAFAFVWIAFNVVKGVEYEEEGPTPLIAAMRCYVASKLGEEVNVPKELL